MWRKARLGEGRGGVGGSRRPHGGPETHLKEWSAPEPSREAAGRAAQGPWTCAWPTGGTSRAPGLGRGSRGDLSAIAELTLCAA